MASDTFPIDFGNGIVCHLDPVGADPFLELGHRGLDVPEFDVPVTEHGVSDGGTVGTSRANARHMRLTVWHDGKWSRREVMAAFTPNVQRTVVTPLGSMPYYVEALDFPESLNEAEKRFSVSLVSPLAYPLGALLTRSGTGSLTYTTTQYNAGTMTDTVPSASEPFEFGTSFPVTAGQTLVSCGIYIKAGSKVESRKIAVYETVDSNRFGALIGEATCIISPDSPTFKYYDVPVNKFFSAAAEVTCVISLDPTTGISVKNQPVGTYPTRALVKRLQSGAVDVVSGGSIMMHDIRGVSTASATEVYVDSNTELPCYPKVTVTLASAATGLAISDGTRTAQITGAMSSGAVVVLDSAARTVTVNGTNRLAWFDKTGDWPMLYPGVSRLTTSVTGTIAVEWRPRMMGLI